MSSRYQKLIQISLFVKKEKRKERMKFGQPPRAKSQEPRQPAVIVVEPVEGGS